MKKVFTLFVFLVFASACKKESKELNLDHKVYELIPNETSGIDFINTIKEDQRKNIINYPYYYNGGGVAIGDLNNDGLPDIYFTGNMSGDQLYYNQGNLKFTDVTRNAHILKSNLWTTGVTFADINNDGWLDIYVCRSGMGSYRNNLLYINQKDGTFKEDAKKYNLNDNGYSVQSYFFDYDIDGDLDMYLVNHSNRFFASQEELFSLKNNPTSEESDKLYRNNGNEIFEDVTKEAGITHFAFGLSAAVGDLNHDGFPDIYAASDFFEPDFLYMNNGDGTFSNKLAESIGHTSFSSMGTDLSDFNNDGLLDIMVCDMQASTNFRKKANMASMDPDRFDHIVKQGYHYQYMQNTLQLNNGNGQFSEIAQLAGVSETDWSWGPLFMDMDNSGHKDLFISNGIRRDIQYKDIVSDLQKKGLNPESANILDIIDNFPIQKIKNFTFKNNGNLKFGNTSDTWGIENEGFSTGAAYGDLDLDGDLELVLNNIDSPASLYKNRTSETKETSNYIQISLKGISDNHMGIGATAEITVADATQFQHLQPSRGFQSSVEPLLHFGVDKANKIDQLKITWPNGTLTTMNNVDVNQRIEVRQNSNKKESETVHETLFKEITHVLQTNYQHSEQPYNDFEKEILLPHKYSQLGPCLAVADINSDGLDDFYIGGAENQAGKLYLQQPTGNFITKAIPIWNRNKNFEDIGAHFFDCDNDNDQDLYVVSGGNEWKKGAENYQDRLYINMGNGAFMRSMDALPKNTISGAMVKAADYDKDGDLDLLVGGRTVPGSYPLPANSSILVNDGNGKFSNATAAIAKELLEIGMVTDADWTDFDNDGDLDIVMAGEWMPITFLENQNGKFTPLKSPALHKTNGWWYSLNQADFDNDGDIDYVFGNLGLNYKYKASETEPFQVYANDFDENGSLDIVLGYFEAGNLFPVRGKQCSTEQMPYLKDKFSDYTSFASSNLEEVYGKEKLNEALHLKAYTFESVYVENLGEGQFKIHSLPVQAQFSSINEFLIDDFDQDGHLDLIIAGNLYESEVETSRNDASIGLLLLGDGKGNFSPMAPMQSGFNVPKNVKGMVKLKGHKGIPLLVIGNNNDVLQVFTTNSN